MRVCARANTLVIDNQTHKLADVLNAILANAQRANHFGVMLPIKDQLARTDALIDQVVYWLYRLSFAVREIAVVEGKK